MAPADGPVSSGSLKVIVKTGEVVPVRRSLFRRPVSDAVASTMELTVGRVVSTKTGAAAASTAGPALSSASVTDSALSARWTSPSGQPVSDTPQSVPEPTSELAWHPTGDTAKSPVTRPVTGSEKTSPYDGVPKVCVASGVMTTLGPVPSRRIVSSPLAGAGSALPTWSTAIV